MKQVTSLQLLLASQKKIFTLTDLQKILHIENDQYASLAARRLIIGKVLERVAKGYFILSDKPPADFELANALYTPSYISLESALNFYGILIQSPQQILSVTTNRTKRSVVGGKTFNYFHLDQRYFTDYERVDNYLIATPEKALIDTIFFTALGKGSLSFEELILTSINKDKLKIIATKIHNQAFKKLFTSLPL